MMALQTLRHTLSMTRLRQPILWFRHRALRDSDVLVASYPRSGSTWLRFLLAEIMTGDSSGFGTVNHSIPEVGAQRYVRPLLPGGGRLIKTHESYRPEYRKAVYLVRDPRDVAISEFAYQLALGRVPEGFDEFVTHFLRGKVNAYGAWQQHVQSWLDSPLAGNGRLLLVRFEDMRRNTETTLATILKFLGRPLDTAIVRAAIANNTVERMRAKELSNPQKASKKGRFVRKGVVGEWRELMTPEHLRLIGECAGGIMLRLGYLDDFSPSPRRQRRGSARLVN